ncbi:unnamed protein product [Penicillium nalgiovense]|uniref:Histone chaperone domain-containing protein n=2 Tax=Penicillium nalgiovense TaxID=60175 RepID=A0A9W4HX01_PENNA|nr:unnamed protein product [Penicillium nalgiovense]CAG7950285.1 unnamed protein product [Penicillium nalgiovense]CAG7961936.1 unnamed protein product [Penicillium nalgiovense]CAG7976567.1 unnamed protein product [Penicillium nalgiovense]CAG8009503.1 unnamed protein product [Penicillium nalgiovense]
MGHNSFPSDNCYIFWTPLPYFLGRHCFYFEILKLYTQSTPITMSNRAERVAEDNYERENDPSPVTGTFEDDSYAKETKPNLRGQVPVQGQKQQYDDPMQPPYSNTDQQLEEDEQEAIDKSNVLRGDRLRHAKPRTSNKYNEGPDEEDLP